MSSVYTPRHRAVRRHRLPAVVGGACAAAVAVVLLLGGNGSLAYWTGTAPIKSGGFSTGGLTLTPVTPVGGQNGCTAWSLTRTGGTTSGTPTSSAVPALLQPHDVLKQTCTYQLRLTGDHLRGTITSSAAAGYQPIAGVTVTQQSMTLGSTSATNGTVAFPSVDGGTTLTLVFTLTVEDSTTSQSNPAPAYGASFSTNGLTVTATQGRP